jgi:hypothetical protein
MELNVQLHATAALPQGEYTPVPIRWEVGWAPEPVWMLDREKSCHARNRTRVIQPLAFRDTDSNLLSDSSFRNHPTLRRHIDSVEK